MAQVHYLCVIGSFDERGVIGSRTNEASKDATRLRFSTSSIKHRPRHCFDYLSFMLTTDSFETPSNSVLLSPYATSQRHCSHRTQDQINDRICREEIFQCSCLKNATAFRVHLPSPKYHIHLNSSLASTVPFQPPVFHNPSITRPPSTIISSSIRFSVSAPQHSTRFHVTTRPELVSTSQTRTRRWKPP